MKAELKYWCFALVTALVLSGISLPFGGCATTGSLTDDIVTKAAAVDTSLSQLQTQQTESAETTQALQDTTQNLNVTAERIKDPELTAQIKRLDVLAKKETDNRKAERTATAAAQVNYTDYKTTSGTALVNQSEQLNKLAAQLKVSVRWNRRLGIALSIIILLLVLGIVLKIAGKLPF